MQVFLGDLLLVFFSVDVVYLCCSVFLFWGDGFCFWVVKSNEFMRSLKGIIIALLPRGRDPSKGTLPGTGDVPLFRDVQQSVNYYISLFGNKAQLEVISPICCSKNR